MVYNEENVINTIQLINSDNLGPITFYKLLQRYGSVKNAIENISEVKKINLLSRTKAEDIYENAIKKNMHVITYDDKNYPQILLNIPDAPPVLYAIGNYNILNQIPAVAIVGARNASINGRKTASRIAFDLTEQNVMVVSGMARGIDAAAHKGALYAKQQSGATIAVLGTGADIPYPNENKSLYCQIAEQGCIISEFSPETLPQANNFPRRNRIVATISAGTLVVEATNKSGSLITAEIAADHNRKIFAIPGAPLEARSCGPNNLIKNGAFLIENAQDIIKCLDIPSEYKNIVLKRPKQQELKLENNNVVKQTQNLNKTKIIDYLNFDGVYVDEIIRTSGMSEAEIALELLELEMSGKIERQSGNKVALIKGK